MEALLSSKEQTAVDSWPGAAMHLRSARGAIKKEDCRDRVAFDKLAANEVGRNLTLCQGQF